MRTTFFALFALVVGCGSSSQPQQKNNPAPDQPASDDAGTPDAQTPVRTMKTGTLLPGAPQNLVLDATFRGSGGWGQFMTFNSGFTAQVTLASRQYSASPASLTTPVGILKDTAADDTKGKALVSLCSFLGGKGPFVAHVWATHTTVAGDPLDLPDDATLFHPSISVGEGSGGKAWDLKQIESKVIGGRTWWRYEAKIDEDLPFGFFNLRTGTKGGAIWVQAPEVVPLGALDAASTGMKTESLHIAMKPRAAEPDEIAAMAAYARQPIQLGRPKLPKMIPGKTTLFE